jgi:hypothetical protein
MKFSVAHPEVRGQFALREVRVVLKEFQDPEVQVFDVLGMFAGHRGIVHPPRRARRKLFKTEQCISALIRGQ